MKLLGILPGNYDLQIFEDLPIYVQKEVLAGKLLYCKNQPALIDRALELIREYEDFKPVYDYYLERNPVKAKV